MPVFGDQSDSHPLTSVQQVVWLDQLLHPATPLYNIGIAWQIRGEPDAALFERAVNLVANAHDALRIVLCDRAARQAILSSVDVKVALVDFSSDAEARAYMQQRLAVPFDLGAGLLWEWQLVRSGTCCYWLQRYHHLVIDGFGIAIVVHALADAYNLLLADSDAAIEAGPSYLEFIDDDQAYQASARFARDRAYWMARFPQVPEALFKRKWADVAGQVAPSAQHRWTIPRAYFDKLSAFAASQDCSIMHLLLAAAGACFARSCGVDEVVIGVPVHNRGSARHKRMLGMFSSISPVGIKVDQDQSFAALLGEVNAELKRSYRHQRFPLAEINRGLDLAQAGRRQLFDVTLSSMSFNGDNAFGTAPTIVVPIDSGYEHAPMAIVMRDHHLVEDVLIDFNYSTQVFERCEAERIQARMARILDQALLDAGTPVYRLPLMDDAERALVLSGFNQTAAEYPQDRLIHQLVEEQAAATPGAIALVCGDEQLSYAALNRRANRLAHHLQSIGVGPDSLVAICVERGVAMVVGLLAILKAGGAYVPLDPGYPSERLAHYLADGEPVAILAHRQTMPALAALSCSQPIVDLGDEACWADQEESNPVGGDADGLAYIIYTSGSTGKPKGVMLTHRNAVNFIAWARTAFAADQLERTLFSTSLNFDLSIYECFVPLASGACITIVDNALALLQGGVDVTLVNTVPSAMDALVDAGAVPAAVRTVNLAGEALKRGLVEKIFAGTAIDTVCNLYGPSETTTYSTWVAMHRANGFVPHIGRPVANTQVYLLDKYLQPVPVGVAGEIYIGGAGVARGYLNRPDLTQERFIDDPFCSGKAVMYKTGDLGRWLADGNIAYIGRNDFQVKIRGFRVELGEIEARLAACPGVREALVVADENQRLLAYLLAHKDAAPSGADLRAALSGSLAEYMIPSAFVFLDAFPLTPNGKLDRKALPVPDLADVLARAYEAPIGAGEEAIAAIWRDLLAVARVGRHDQFFELGGHSLLAVQLLSQVREQLGLELSLRDLFAQPTLAGFAALVAGARASSLGAIAPADRSKPLALSFAQQRLWFLDQLDHCAGAAYHMPGQLRLRGRLDKAALKRALDGIVARHENLRTTFVDAGGAPAQRIAPPGTGFALTERDLGALAGHEQEFAVSQCSTDEASHPFDLATGPLIRGQLLRLANDDHILLITKHHIISDGWSTTILVRELSALYRGDTLPPLPVQYADYAAWQRSYLQGEILQAQTGFWKTALAGAPELIALPTDRPRPAQQSYAGRMLPFSLSAGLSAGLRKLSQRHGTTLFMTMLAGWSALLSRMSGQGEVVVGTPVANRQRADIESLIGFFVNTLAMRVTLDDDPDVATLLARVKATALQAFEHQDLPFEQVVEALQPARSMRHSPLFQVVLSMNSDAAGALHLPGLSIELAGQDQETAQFDLGLSLTDSGDRITGELRYATALFDTGTVARMASHFERLLAAMVTDERVQVSAIDLLDHAGRSQLVDAFNDTALPFPQHAMVHQLFEAQVDADPDAIALRCDGESLSYGQLNRRANAVAHRLLGLGVRADQRVGLCARRSVELIVGMLGILKAGGAYVPLDAEYPAERLAFMLEDSEPVAVLAHSALAGKLPPMSMPLVLLDAPFEAADSNPGIALHSGHLAYVIYTSGSTGNPKGVMVEHRNVIQLVVNEPCVQIDAGARLAFCANPAFDASTWEVWGGLLNGATLVVVPHAVLLDANDFGSLLEREEVSILHLTVGLFNQYASPLAHIFRKLDCLLFGGDQPSLATVVRVMQQSAPRRMLHCYGPTETTTFAVTHAIPTTIADSLPIGRPIANTQVYVLDRHMQPVPLGVAGEMYIGGAGVARGYLKRDDLTAERFLPDPFRPGARMYRTGDLGRWLADGTLEFLGRNDFQVKIRGFRVELGEIESRLAACKGVREAVVLAREDIPGDKRLVAYLIGSGLSAAGLRTELSASLADYMIPSAFVTLDAYPLTPNGKLDRRALPAPDGSSAATREYAAPQGAVEEALARIWQDLLGIGQVGRHDHFFELGGHSLMAVQVTGRTRELCMVDMSLRELFEYPVLSQLAERIKALQHQEFMGELDGLSQDELLAILAEEGGAA